MLDPALLRDFMKCFFGYGSWDARLWFIGMEEGGGDSLEELVRRLKAWDRSNELMDIKAFHNEINVGGKDWFGEHPPIQSTWGKLIRLALAAAGRDTDAEAVRRYQRDELGRRGGPVALIELLPLPSPSVNHWLYAEAAIPSIATRAGYRNEMLPRRMDAIVDRIAKHKPSAVIFYGMAYRACWEVIAGRTFEAVKGERFLIAEDYGRRFVLAPHPAARGVRNADYEAIGRTLRPRQN